MTAYLIGAGIVCGALVSWWRGPEEAPALLACWLPRVALTLFAAFALNVLLASEALAVIAGQALSAVLGFFAGGMTQAAGMTVASDGLGSTGNRYAMLLVVCVWVALFAVVGMLLKG